MKQSILIVFGTLALLLSACNEGKEVDESTAIQQIDTTRYKRTGFRFPKLLPQVDSIVKDWPVFKDFKGVGINLGNSTLEDLQRKSNNLLLVTDSIARSLPDTLNSRPIISRLSVVKTRASLLHQEVLKGKPDSTLIKNYIRETEQAIANFVLQINEKIQKDNIDLSRREDEAKELEKQRKARDSIFQLELEDQVP